LLVEYETEGKSEPLRGTNKKTFHAEGAASCACGIQPKSGRATQRENQLWTCRPAHSTAFSNRLG
jgi:hypothetical protein